MTSGLEGVVAAETILSHTDQKNGMVWVRGHDLPSLVADCGFEGTVALLWDEFAGTGLTAAAVQAACGVSRQAAFVTSEAWLHQAAGRLVRGRAARPRQPA